MAVTRVLTALGDFTCPSSLPLEGRGYPPFRIHRFDWHTLP
jgi:hypothetical protein